MKFVALKKFDCGDKDENGCEKIYKPGDVYVGDQVEVLLKAGLIAEAQGESPAAEVVEEVVEEVVVEEAPEKKSKKKKDE